MRSVIDLWREHPEAAALTADPSRARRNADHICDTLNGIWFNPNPSLVPIRPVLLEAAVRAQLDDASRYFVDLLRRTCWSLTEDPVELTRLAGLRPEQTPLLCADGARHEMDFSVCNGRLDVLLDGGVPVFLEANFSAANVDPIVLHFQGAAYRALYGVGVPSHLQAASEPFEGRARLYARVFRERALPASVAVVGCVDKSDVGDIRYFDAEASYLRAHGFESEFLTPAAFAAKRRPYTACLKHYLSEYWQEIDLPVELTRAAHADTWFVVPDSGRALSSKIVFAWLSAGSVALSDVDREFVRRHVPWTRIVEPGEVEFEGRNWALSALASERRRDFVLKPMTSCGGLGVILGQSTEPEAWRARVEEAMQARDHVLQQYVEADTLTMDFFDRHTGNVQTTAVSYVLGTYVVDGLSAGATIRHLPHNAPGVVNLSQGASFNSLF